MDFIVLLHTALLGLHMDFIVLRPYSITNILHMLEQFLSNESLRHTAFFLLKCC